MKLKLYALLLAAVASVSSVGLASAAPAVPDRLYFPNDRGTGWIYIDNDNTQVPPIAFIPLAATAGTAPRTKCLPLANTPPTATAR